MGNLSFPAQVRLDDRGNVARNALIEKEILVTLTLSHVGTKVAIKMLDLHLQSLFVLMRTFCWTLFWLNFSLVPQGAIINMQAWSLQRFYRLTPI